MQKSKISKTQMTIYYNPRTSGGRKALAYVQQTQHSILALDITKTSPTPTQWLNIAGKLKINIQDLVSKDHPWFLKKYKKTKLEKEDWLKIIKQNPEVVIQPIVLKGQDIFLIKTPSCMFKLMDTCW